jgi:hypothetical protein
MDYPMNLMLPFFQMDKSWEWFTNGLDKDDFENSIRSFWQMKNRNSTKVAVSFDILLFFFIYSLKCQNIFSIRSLIFEISAFMNFQEFFIQLYIYPKRFQYIHHIWSCPFKPWKPFWISQRRKFLW